MLPPPLPHQIKVLQSVIDRVDVNAADGGPPPVVIVGLDGTLFESRPRTLQILREFADEIRPNEPDVAAALDGLQLNQVHLLLNDTLREVGIIQPGVLRDASGFWFTRYHHSDYLVYDTPEPGAAEFVCRLHQAGASIAYVSSRDVPGMLLGTVAALREHGFPIGEPGVQLVLKRDATLGDEAFKRETLPELARGGDVAAVFDSDPAVCAMAHGYFPDALVGLMDTWEQEPPPPESGIEHVRDFRLR